MDNREDFIKSIYMKMIQANLIFNIHKEDENVVFSDAEIEFIKNLE